MAIFKMDCRKCTNKYSGFYHGEPAEWCKPIADGENPIKIKDTGSGRTDILSCDYFTTMSKQIDMYPYKIN